MGCEVWPSPYFGDLVEMGRHLDGQLLMRRAKVGAALSSKLSYSLARTVRSALLRDLDETTRGLTLEPLPAELVSMAEPYISRHSIYFAVHSVGNLVNFAKQGASGAINAMGMNCMVGASIAAAVPGVRADLGQVPIINLTYGGAEGPAQRIRLETFVHQVKTRGAAGDQSMDPLQPRM